MRALIWGQEVTRASEKAFRASKFLMPSPSLTKLETQKYYQNEANLNGVFSNDNLPNTKDERNVTIFMSTHQ